MEKKFTYTTHCIDLHCGHTELTDEELHNPTYCTECNGEAYSYTSDYVPIFKLNDMEKKERLIYLESNFGKFYSNIKE